MERVPSSRLREAYRRHRLVIDAVLVLLIALIFAAVGFGRSWQVLSLSPGTLPVWISVALTAVACVFMLTKRRAPLLSLFGAALMFVLDLLTVGGVGTLLVLLDVLWMAAFLASSRGRRQLLALIVIFAALIGAVPFAIGAVSAQLALLIVAQFGAIFGTDYWWAVAMSQANELTELHRRRADELVEDAERAREEAVRGEREIMARELHDVVAGHVLAMAIRAEAALSTSPDATSDRDALQAVRDAGLDAHAALRRMIAVLRRGEGETASAPRLGDIDRMVQDARDSGLTVRLVSHSLDSLTVPLEQTLVRVVREALVNCVRHASGADVGIVIEGDATTVRALITSEGGTTIAAQEYRGSGWGLSMLRERVEALGGEFVAGPAGDGWSVLATLPREGSRA